MLVMGKLYHLLLELMNALSFTTISQQNAPLFSVHVISDGYSL